MHTGLGLLGPSANQFSMSAVEHLREFPSSFRRCKPGQAIPRTGMPHMPGDLAGLFFYGSNSTSENLAVVTAHAGDRTRCYFDGMRPVLIAGPDPGAAFEAPSAPWHNVTVFVTKSPLPSVACLGRQG